MNAELDDYRWLTGPDGRGWLERLAGDGRPITVLAQHLRKDLSAPRVHLLLEQIELRVRAREKFSAADRMFFTRKALEQSTDQWVARYKAERFPAGTPVADLCCGLGGDLLAMAARGPAAGYDRDPALALVAAANLDVLGLSNRAAVHCSDVAAFAPRPHEAWHLDPDRRAQGRRSTWIELYEPGVAVIERLLANGRPASIKLAPAAQLPKAWQREAELEWISRDRQCRQLVAWRHLERMDAGLHRATIVGSRDGEGDRHIFLAPTARKMSQSPACVLRSIVGEPDAHLPARQAVGRYLFDADPAILAAGLLGTLAGELGLEPIVPGPSYLTGDAPRIDPAVATFEVTDVLPLDRRRLRRLLAEREIGVLEIKKRGVSDDPERLRRELHLQGGNSATLLLAPLDGRTTAILARRVPAP